MYKSNKNIISMLAIFLMVMTSFSLVVGTTSTEFVDQVQCRAAKNTDDVWKFDVSSTFSSDLPLAITVSDSNPFFMLIATPLAVRYNDVGNQEVIPLYVKDFSDPSKAVVRAEQQVGIYADFAISDIFTPKEISLFVAEMFWDETSTALLIKNDFEGYEFGIIATPIASYLGIPVIVTDEIDGDVKEVLNGLGVENLYICGDLHSSAYWIKEFCTVEEIIDECIDVISDKFGETVGYITMANPLDITSPQVLDTELYEFSGKIASGIMLPTQSLNMLFRKTFASHEFTIPGDYKYARLKIDLNNLDSEYVKELGDELVFLLASPEGYNYIYGGTMGGIPIRDTNGDIIQDQLHLEFTIYDNPGKYTMQVFGKWFGQKTGSYDLDITVEKLDTPIVPLMDGLSSIAPYLTAYHKGIVFAKSEFAFAADDHILHNGEPCPGITQPGSNPNLIEPSNQHTWAIHDELNVLLADLAGIEELPLEDLRDHYAETPLYIAIAADPTMVPMYFYYNPDGRPDDNGAYLMGFALPSDFIYGNVDPDSTDPENDTYSYWPFQENIVGRVTGRDVQDASALIARTFFYDNIIDAMGSWKDNALVSTGCGLEFQNLPIATRLSHMLYGGRGEPTKFPTGESTFINLRLHNFMDAGFTNTKSTFLLESQREGFSKEDIELIEKAGLLNRLLFPKNYIYRLDSDTKVTGGQDQMDSNLIFSFAHGSYNLFEHGDVLMDARGFPLITPITRIYPQIRSGLSAKGAFDVRGVENMEYGPSVMFIVSCITGRTDGLEPENTISQTFLHAGVNAYIGATRVTADPGYLEPRPLPGGWGIGALGFMKATIDLLLRGKYPDAHFGAVIAEDFIIELIEHDTSTGLALRNAKNVYLEKDANSTFLWTPPLTFSTGYSQIDQEFLKSTENSNPVRNERTRTLDKKYVALHEFTLYGDPAFNPYQSVNNG
jgi:peptidase C25-like protein